MKLTYGRNMNIKKDIEEVILKKVLSETCTWTDNEKEESFEISFKDGVTELTQAQESTLAALLSIRVEAGQMDVRDLEDFIPSEEMVEAFFISSIFKPCESMDEVELYRNRVLANVNADVSVNLLSPNTTVVLERITEAGEVVYDVLTVGLSKTDKSKLTAVAKGFKLSRKAHNINETKIKPLNMAISSFGNEVVKTSAGVAGEILGNTLSTLGNAGTEGLTAFTHSFVTSSTIKDTLTDGRLTRVKEKGSEDVSGIVTYFADLFGKGKKKKSNGMI